MCPKNHPLFKITFVVAVFFTLKNIPRDQRGIAYFRSSRLPNSPHAFSFYPSNRQRDISLLWAGGDYEESTAIWPFFLVVIVRIQ